MLETSDRASACVVVDKDRFRQSEKQMTVKKIKWTSVVHGCHMDMLLVFQEAHLARGALVKAWG